MAHHDERTRRILVIDRELEAIFKRHKPTPENPLSMPVWERVLELRAKLERIGPAPIR